MNCDEIPRRSGGSHRKWHNSTTGSATVIPDWGSKDLKQGTIKSAIQQLGIDWQDFEDA
ncbi:type II toxin-antitoxin system HicA family toxin [Candidatus Entotheonella palauensis]|uniref:type II toxin-antitoxin system HicA family toxin n=1 Tax=Candidatus Entotheonella palauensis TaxID=93172 RepID=UPI000B7E900D|nr:type II toxin-antitoxin system HicA family toxin [Candidatus Entotheonella palauensis]